MRRLALLVLTALFVVGCEGDSTEPDIEAAVAFRLDSQTCRETWVMRFFIDGRAVGTSTMAPGGNSPAFDTTPTTHTIGAEIANATWFDWGPVTIDLRGGGTHTQLLTC